MPAARRQPRREPYESYLGRILAKVAPLESVVVPLAEAAGRHTARGVLAPHPAPLFTNSAMDGFAIRHEDLNRSPRAKGRHGRVVMPVTGDVRAGDVAGTWEPGSAVQIMTGARMPGGTDTVIPVEESDRPFDDQIDTEPAPDQVVLPVPWARGKNVRIMGEDVAVGDTLIPVDTLLDGAALAALAAVGVRTVTVRPTARVAVIVTGDELLAGNESVEDAARAGRIPDSNSILVTTTLICLGARPTKVVASSDDAAEFARAINETSTDPEIDLIITTGGASVGAHDVARRVLTGAGLQFSAVAIQPAKPQGSGLINGIPVLALPGNPGAVHASLYAIVAPVLAQLTGVAQPPPEYCVAAEGWNIAPGRRQFVPVRVFAEPGARADVPRRIRPVIPGGVAAHRVASLAMSDGLVIIDPDLTQVRPGDLLPVIITRTG